MPAFRRSPIRSLTTVTLLAATTAQAWMVDCAYYVKPNEPRTHIGERRARRPILRGFKRTRKALGKSALNEILFKATAALKAAGVKFEEITVTVSKGGKMRALRILPDVKGHKLNRMAHYLEEGIAETKIVYSPASLRDEDALGLFDIDSRTLYLSDLSIDHLAIDPTDLHETTHWYHAWLYQRKIESLFHAEVESAKGPISEAGSRANYEQYMSFEEATTFGLDDRTGVGLIIEKARAAEKAKWSTETEKAFTDEVAAFLDTLDQHEGILEQADATTERARKILAETPDAVTVTETEVLDVKVHQLEWTLDEANGIKYRLYTPIKTGETQAELLARVAARLEASHALFTDVRNLLKAIPKDELKRLTRWTPATENRLLEITSQIRKRLVAGHRYAKF